MITLTKEEIKALVKDLPEIRWNTGFGEVGNFLYVWENGKFTIFQLDLGINDYDFVRDLDEESLRELNELYFERLDAEKWAEERYP